MDFLSVFMAVFSVIGALDLIIGNRFGLGKEFEKGFMLFGTMALSMIGMIILAPALGAAIQPALDVVYRYLHIDPSLLPGMLLANDMGGAPLATAVAKDETIGAFNALVVSSMMGCTISFTIPFALGVVKEEQHPFVLFGFLCGIVTIPVGCFAAGLVYGIKLLPLLWNIFPMAVFSVLIAVGLFYIPKVCIKIFSILGKIINIAILIGLSLGIVRFLTGLELVPGLATLEEGARVCLNASAVMTGAFPFMFLASKLLQKPLRFLGSKLNINEASAFGFFSSLATSVTTYNAMEEMDDKGVVLNSAFAISAAFTFAGHLAFTMSMNKALIPVVIFGKLTAGITALLLAIFMYKRTKIK